MTSEQVLDIFKLITAIPRESGHEEPMTQFLCDWAAARNLECRKDETGNVCIIREAAKGKENIPAIALQAHQDMVCEKLAGVEHDFRRDPIKYEIEDGWMIAKQTTLGADDGIGVAACLALLESEAPTGKIECLFTISEETGMDGAFALQPGFFDAKVLINLDSEDEGQLFIGCAGGEHTDARFKYESEALADAGLCLELSISGGAGGHSGDDINKHRANTVHILASFLAKCGLPYRLVSFEGGGKHNTIARECKVVLACADAGISAKFDAYAQEIKKEYAKDDPALVFECRKIAPVASAIEDKVAKALISALASCPHGVLKMSPDIEGLVQTSSNLAAVVMEKPGIVRVNTSQRSSVVAELDEAVLKVSANFADAGAYVENYGKYPGWKPNVNSHLLKVCVDSYRKLFDEDPLVLAIHAGLECGLFLEKFPDLDMISFGPTLRGVHTPGEKLELASMDRFVELLDDVVCNYR
ncbi:MAG: beta-Ala-His dipeptidase [Bacteroidales bacterium]|nr:beta-Ala-His dipeptidase [Bacteroidales bacterium]